ncbi:methylesterase 9-like [Herrania umbratica]|uniref:Methylesterase 9-like n=1 Tax=Herrania umbratica TaxID=108875 RepID=A0A6J0ZH83_9ROSI|nr:methylesterase 9-like [Herrania umbratica]
MAEKKNQKHFVLVHGLCHGAWCWYKLQPLLESTGHRVTALDLTTSGINMKAIQDVQTFHEYTKPLLEILASLPPDEKVIVVGHSLGGMNLALAMDEFPNKISVGVFLTAFMPDTLHQPSYVLEKYLGGVTEELLKDAQLVNIGSLQIPFTITVMGPKFLSSKLYHLSSVEIYIRHKSCHVYALLRDLELAKALIRPGSLFTEDLSKGKNFSGEGFGTVTRVYVVCNEDNVMVEEFQRWMIQNNPPKDVLEIKTADHMPMFSKTQEVCDCLLEIANKYSQGN